jgi:hypothetical protein
MGASAIELCGRCRREILPAQKGPSWHRDVHRAPAKNMARAVDPKAEKIKARKERKSLRSVTREFGFTATATLFLVTRAADFAPVNEDCPECAKRQNAVRARFLGYDPSTNRAYAQIIGDDA